MLPNSADRKQVLLAHASLDYAQCSQSLDGAGKRIRSKIKTLSFSAMSADYLERILKARVYDAAKETPLDYAPSLFRRLGNRVYFKREDLQPVFSFKLRGAYNKMAQLSPELLRKGVIAASAGNHAQGVALGDNNSLPKLPAPLT